MKLTKTLPVFGALILGILLMLGCENTTQDTVVSDKNLEAILTEMAALGDAEKKIITFDITFDEPSNSYVYDNVEIIKESKKIVDFAKGADPSYKYMASSYEVSCTDAAGNTTSTTCHNYSCVGYAVAACVENGGCATVCSARATYYPSIVQ